MAANTTLREHQGYRFTIATIANGMKPRTVDAELWYLIPDSAAGRWRYFRRCVAKSELEAVGFYGLFWRAFDRWVWEWPVVRTVKLVKVPKFGGRWVGHGVSSYRNERGERQQYPVTITITQRWTTCLVHMEAGESRSDSVIGAIIIGDGRRPTLSYEYENRPRMHAAATMHAHRGMTRLEMVDSEHLEGEYYTGRDRQHYGILTLTKQ